MEVDHAFGNGQAQTQTAILARDRLAPLLERIENPRLNLWRYAEAIIDNLDRDVMFIVVIGPNTDGPFRRRKLDRVLDQIPKNLLQSRRIRPAMMLGCLKPLR